MRRATDFTATAKHGARAVQRDVVIHARVVHSRGGSGGEDCAPKVGLIIAKSVGSAVERHRVARRLRHVARTVLTDLDQSEQVVIRALPGSAGTVSAGLGRQVRTGLQRIHQATGYDR